VLQACRNGLKTARAWAIKEEFRWFWRHVYSTSEGFNSVIQALKYAARGFHSFTNYRTRILFFCGELDLKPQLQCH